MPGKPSRTDLKRGYGSWFQEVENPKTSVQSFQPNRLPHQYHTKLRGSEAHPSDFLSRSPSKLLFSASSSSAIVSFFSSKTQFLDSHQRICYVNDSSIRDGVFAKRIWIIVSLPMSMHCCREKTVSAGRRMDLYWLSRQCQRAKGYGASRSSAA